MVAKAGREAGTSSCGWLQNVPPSQPKATLPLDKAPPVRVQAVVTNSPSLKGPSLTTSALALGLASGLWLPASLL